MSFVIVTLLFHKVSIIFNTLLPMLRKMLYVSIVIFRLNFGVHHKIFVSIYYHLQNGIHIVHPSEGQTGGSQRMPHLGCEQDGKEETTPFF
jgi:hypothetical protein